MPAISTYRLQLRPEFGFDAAAEIVPYLAKLGVSHVYCSPYLQAAPGSAHGYDVVDHGRVNQELGGTEAHARFVTALKKHGLGQILDIVPNHMAIPGRQNAWWWDVLKHGRSSRFAKYFDIDWESSEERMRDKVLLPVLGDHYGHALERGELKLDSNDGEAVVRYFDQEFPLDPNTFDGAELGAIDSDLDRKDQLLSAQHYRLAFWRVAGEELDYRRFFDVNTLIALRAEDTDVFDATHERVLEWLKDGTLDGIRVDHIDGLRDPAEYLHRLRASAGPDAIILVEKILEAGESMPVTWPVEGTTGYDLLNLVDGLFVEPDGESLLQEFYEHFTENTNTWEDHVHDGKRQVVDTLLQSDVTRLTDLFSEVCQQHRNYRDYTRSELRSAIEAVLVTFPVYRSYVSPASQSVTSHDRAMVEAAITEAQLRDPELPAPLLDFLGKVLTLQIDGKIEAALAMRFQQLSGPVMAKGVEDTAFYRYFRLASRNEVGGAPNVFATRPDDFHEAAMTTQRLWPKSMIASTTHDTKRSEDTRHRINTLPELAQEWAEAVERWSKINAHLRRPVNGDQYPDRNVEYLIYQTLVGAYPLSVDRLVDYLAKATKEAKSLTTWTEPNEEYDAAVASFAEGILGNTDFVEDLEVFLQKVIPAARINSLAATTVKLTMPGIPDTYQGTELWTESLVDPDNRRPVDYQLRNKLLDELSEIPEPTDERAKLLVTNRLLHLRKARPDAFDGRADYNPVTVRGDQAHRTLAYRRGADIAVVVPRGNTQTSWGDTQLDLGDGDWRNVFTNETYGSYTGTSSNIDLATLLKSFPVAVLERKS